ncbi:MAG: hypothetical protein ACPGSO_00695 [Vicingaceae bacterium]
MIDVTKCMGCRKGVSLFTEKDGEYTHVDLFATPEAGASYKCENSENIGGLLVKNGDKGTLLPNEELKQFFERQEFWWEDIIDLAYDTLKEQNKVSEFFNTGEKGNMMWNKPNLEIENGLLALAEKEGIKVDKEAYPDLIKWQ